MPFPTTIRLTELVATLNAQIPTLVAFAVLRWLAWSSAACTCALCVPASLTRLARRFRAILLASGTLLVTGFVGADPPELECCSDYAAQRGQGATALLALVVLLTSNRPLALALALSALKGVGDLTSAAVPLAMCASYAACNVRGDAPTYVLVFIYTLTHAIHCYDLARSERTHATVLATIFVGWHLAVIVGAALFCCPLRALRAAGRPSRASVLARPRLNPPPARQPKRCL